MAKRGSGEVIALEPVREPVAVPPTPQQTVAAEQGLRDYLDVLLKRRWIVLAFFVVTVACVAAWVWRMPRVYRATATVEINPTTPRYLGNGVQDVAESAASLYWQSKEFAETQYQIIRSRMLAQRVVDRLGLATDASFLGLDKITDPEQRRAAMTAGDPAGRLQGMISVEPVKDSRIARLSADDTNPERAMRIANALAEEYMAQNLDRKLEVTRSASAWLSDQVSALKGKLESSELDLHRFKRENDILTASFEDRQSITSQRLLALNDTLTKVMTRRAELESRRRTLDAARKRVVDGEADALEALPAVAQNPLVSQLKMRLLALNEEQAALEERYLDKHPRRAEAETKLVEVRGALAREIAKSVTLAETESREAADTEKELRALIEGVKREAFELNKKEIDYSRLKREQDSNQRLFELVQQRQKEADLTGLLRTNSVQVVDSALVPRVPIKPNRKVILLIAALIGFLGGVGLAFLFEHLDNTMKSHEDIERMGLPFLGIVPTMKDADQANASPAERGRQRDLYAHRRPKSSVAECVRSVRTNLLFVTPEKPLKKLVVTSSGPQEGKTTFAINIAIAMAQSGSRTLIVDTDMRRPRLHRSFGVDNDVGISSMIVQQVKIEDAVKETVVPNLFLLPCGPIPPNPAELLHTARFKQIVAEFGSRFDRIIFDSPPVAAVTDAPILAADADGVVVVCKAGKTLREMANRTVQALTDVKANIFGVVLNDVDVERRGYGHYYYYQKYGYYYGEKPSEA